MQYINFVRSNNAVYLGFSSNLLNNEFVNLDNCKAFIMIAKSSHRKLI